jgi:hypothetical protein
MGAALIAVGAFVIAAVVGKGDRGVGLGMLLANSPIGFSEGILVGPKVG